MCDKYHTSLSRCTSVGVIIYLLYIICDCWHLWTNNDVFTLIENAKWATGRNTRRRATWWQQQYHLTINLPRRGTLCVQHGRKQKYGLKIPRRTTATQTAVINMAVYGRLCSIILRRQHQSTYFTSDIRVDRHHLLAIVHIIQPEKR